jgi:hypothetical protein
MAMKPEFNSVGPADEARLLLLIAHFSGNGGSLEGRTKLAKLDFLLRYPRYLQRALEIRAPQAANKRDFASPETIAGKMVRNRFGPWDPAYYDLLGRLLSRGLITTVEFERGLGFRITDRGQELASRLRAAEPWQEIDAAAAVLKRHFDLQGTTLKNFVYKHFPEITKASWADEL